MMFSNDEQVRPSDVEVYVYKRAMKHVRLLRLVEDISGCRGLFHSSFSGFSEDEADFVRSLEWTLLSRS